MTVADLKELLNAKCITEQVDLSREISCGYTCDLLSWVLAHGKSGMAWSTVQTHMNVIAVAVLMDMACVILTEGTQAEEASLKKANDEELPILCTDKTAYEVCVLLGQAGILPPT